MLTTLRLALIVTLVFSSFHTTCAQGLLGSQPNPQQEKSTDAPAAPANSDVPRVAKRNVSDPSLIQFDEIKSSQQDNSFQPTQIPKNLTLTPNLPGAVKSQNLQTQKVQTVQKAQPLKSLPLTNLPQAQDQRNIPPAIGVNARKSIPAQPVSSTKITTAPSMMAPLMTAGWSPQPTFTDSSAGVSTPVTVTSVVPQISTRVVAPRFVNLNQIAPVRIQLRNTTVTDAKSVKLVAILPAHAKFRAAQPQPTNVDGRKYEFIIEQIDRNQTQEVQIDVVPTEKKPLAIETQLWISNSQNVEVGVRQPNLTISSTGPQQSHTGKPMTHTVIVENTGDGIAENIKLDCVLPESVELVEGNREYYMRQLAPGTTAKLQFRTAAYKPGDTKLGFQVASRGLQIRKASSAVRIYQPQLVVSATGPKMNFVNRDGIYSIQVENTGQVDVTDVEVAVRVPDGMKVTTVSREAKIDKSTGIFVWNFQRLAASAQQTIQLKAISGTAGRQVCRIAASSKETRAEKFDLVTDVQTRADVKISVNCQSGPVEVGNETVFVINVDNKGSSAATGVEVLVELPPSLMPIASKAYSVSELDNSIRFATLNLSPGESRQLQFKASGVSKGEHVVRAIMTLQETKRRLIAEDSVYIFETDHSKVTESLKPEFKRR